MKSLVGNGASTAVGHLAKHSLRHATPRQLISLGPSLRHSWPLRYLVRYLLKSQVALGSNTGTPREYSIINATSSDFGPRQGILED